MEHTSIPWRATQWGQVISIDAPHDKRGGIGIAFINPGSDTEKGIPSRKDMANAKFIVRAANAHDAMVDALQRCVECLGQGVNAPSTPEAARAVDRARGALKKALS